MSISGIPERVDDIASACVFDFDFLQTEMAFDPDDLMRRMIAVAVDAGHDFALLNFSFEDPAARLSSDVIVVSEGRCLHEEGQIEIAGRRRGCFQNEVEERSEVFAADRSVSRWHSR